MKWAPTNMGRILLHMKHWQSGETGEANVFKRENLVKKNNADIIHHTTQARMLERETFYTAMQGVPNKISGMSRRHEKTMYFETLAIRRSLLVGKGKAVEGIYC